MTMLEHYLREMEASGLLSLLYNGYKLVNNKPTIEFVTLELAMADKGFCRFTESNLTEEYLMGI